MIRRVSRVFVVAVVACGLAACPKGGEKSKQTETPPPSGSGTGDAQRLLPDEPGSLKLPPAPPLPDPPPSLPALAANPRVTADALVLGELLFHDPRFSADGKRACATCHDPAHGWAGGVDNAANGKPNARRTPTLVNLAWTKEYGWDGRATSLTDYLPAHAKGQLDALDASTPRIAAVPLYAAHIARIGGSPQEAIVQALEAYVLTRYEGDTPWDTMERTARATPGSASSDPIIAGYQLFTGKAQCSVCHTPPLYTDNGYHRVERETLGDKGRGMVDPALAGAFKTPTLRGAMTRRSFFHSGSKKSVDEVIAHYVASASDKALDPALARIALTPDESRQLAIFLNMLSINRPRPTKPVLP